MSLTVQLYTMLSMIGMGTVVGMALDTYHRFLKRSKRNLFLVFLNDIFFWILMGVITFYVLLKTNEGEVRIYIFLALLCGFSFYMAIIRKSYMNILEIVIRVMIKISKIIQKMFRLFIILPLKWIFHVIMVIVLSLFHFITKIFVMIKNIVQAIFLWIIRIIIKLLPRSFKEKLKKLYGFWLQVRMKLCNYYKRLKQLFKKR